MKKARLLILSTILTFQICGCSPSCDCTTAKLNGTNLKFWPGEDIKESEFAGFSIYDESYGYRSYLDGSYKMVQNENVLELPNKYILYTVLLTPDDPDRVGILHSVYSTDDQTRVYNLSMSSSEIEVDQALRKLGFDYYNMLSSSDPFYCKDSHRVWIYGSYIKVDVTWA